jgi:kumamolisin
LDLEILYSLHRLFTGLPIAALMAWEKKKPAGSINPTLYSTPNLCRDITSGDNKTTSKKTGYSAAIGWDACTGWGVLSKL